MEQFENLTYVVARDAAANGRDGAHRNARHRPQLLVVRWRVIPLLVLAVVAQSSAAQAQWFWGPSWSGGSTAAGDLYRGQADLLRAQGEYNRHTSEGALAYQLARAQYLENQRRWFELEQGRRRIGQDVRLQYYAEQRVSREHAKSVLESRPPASLAVADRDPVSGKLFWPAALQGQGFDTSRETIEQLLTARTQATLTLEMKQQWSTGVKAMQSDLRQQVRSLPVEEYIAARRFLDNLAAEGRRTVSVGSSIARRETQGTIVSRSGP